MAAEEIASKVEKEYSERVKTLKNDAKNYAEAQEYASETGRILGDLIADNLNDEYSGGGISFEDAKTVLSSPMKLNYDEVISVTTRVQKEMNKEAGIGLNPVVVPFNIKRVEGLAKEIAEMKKLSRDLISNQIQNVSMNIVDESVKANAKVHEHAGMEVKVIRTYDGEGLHDGKDPCIFCIEKDGTWTYHEAIAKNVFRRHPGCGCEIVYTTEKSSQIQTNWTQNKWEETGKPISNDNEAFNTNTKTAHEHRIDAYTGENVTAEYSRIGLREPGEFSTTSDFVLDKEHANEYRVGKLLCERIGGKLECLGETLYGKPNPDYLWRNKLWDLKTPKRIKNLSKLVQKGLQQIETNPGGIVVDISSLNNALDEITKVITNRMRISAKTKTDVIIVRENEIVTVLRYSSFKHQ